MQDSDNRMVPNERRTVVFVGNDLMFQSKISSACQSASLALKVLRNPQTSLKEPLGEITPSLIIVDLGLPNIDLEALICTGKQEYPQSLWLGYGAHVLAERLEQASQLGFDMVLTRGQFDRDMHRILQTSTTD